MESRYRAEDAPTDLLQLRCYTSRLLGAEPSLVLHGGGNTSVKGTTKDFFGDDTDVLWVKGSGWDLATIEPAGFSPVRMRALLRMADLAALSDVDMVREQRAALLDPSAPDPSIEAILHAILPHRFVDHTHADAVITLTNTPDGAARIRDVLGDRVLYVPYVMPGFVLARAVREITRGADWSRLEGMVLMHHGLFTFSDDARESYERTIRLVSEAEDALAKSGAWSAPRRAARASEVDARALATIRREVSRAAGRAMIARVDASEDAAGYASRDDVARIATRGPVTPDHVIRTKRVPAVIDGDPAAAIGAYAREYDAYFTRHDDGSRTRLDAAPRWAVWRGVGTIAFGTAAKAAAQVGDIARHTIRCVQWAEALGGWTPLGERDLFDMEYWELEQRKLRKPGASPSLAGRVALITGGASGIGRAVALRFRAEGAAVCVLDRRAEITSAWKGDDALGVACDVTDTAQVNAAIDACVRRFGGLDLLVSNAGDFPPSKRIEELDDAHWERSLALNLTSHLKVLRAATPYLELGVEPAVIMMASRNVPAPGPGAAAYSVSKAGLTQLARVAAIELAPAGVRVDVLHPDKVFDTELWSDETIASRAKSYGVSVDRYKRQNLLRAEVTTKDVAEAALALVKMRATTGAQLPIDGGSDRVI
ncbi:bifunctional aldolase/short-chain dehydrogenase [Sandaracinus amylolyticus]|uniref:3-oxoacyl-[acyl-carrier protein] reductase n=1 Tax=Sandaracinus amylolyticus TaxID=927083 RepID=A0A0F6SG83_9BACT|nr:bifunctional aldolase/short-chain dehydrogenase [Sandaracinus amylolyticus]AKF08244.1 3-oxoacyl-[acyl-carrier protein] reductase [Sandaracinus amylolyticus]